MLTYIILQDVTYTKHFRHKMCHFKWDIIIKLTQPRNCLPTFSMLTYYMLKYPLACSRYTLQWIFQQPMMMEPSFNSLKTLHVANESVCSTRIYQRCGEVFYKFWRLRSPMACLRLIARSKARYRRGTPT